MSVETEEDSGMLSAKGAATALGTDARTLRKFLRKKNGLVGQGQRWAIDPEDIDDLRTEFEAWLGGKATDGPVKAKAAKKGKQPKPPAEEADELDELDDIEDLEDLEPTDEELMEAELIDAIIDDYDED